MTHYDHATMLACRLGPWAPARALRPHEAEREALREIYAPAAPALSKAGPLSWVRLRLAQVQIRAVLRSGK